MFETAEELIEHSGQVASLPEVFYRVNEAIEDPECSFSEIAHIIGQDSALSARLLKIVNSPFYGFDTRVETITHAITIIGMVQLRDLILATLVVDKFKGLSTSVMDMKSFWLHNIACGLMARILATFCHEKGLEKYYVLGLIHDIGRLIMFLSIPEQMNRALEIARAGDELLSVVEKEMFGFDHSRVGYLLIQSWKLPELFQVAVQHSHDSAMDGNLSSETAILHVSDVFVHALQFGSSGEVFIPPLNPLAWNKLNLSSSMIPLLVKQLDREIKDAVINFS
ncbi:MAG: HDOD domain-containing protein [Nitrospinota bacterium]|nr:HDOD domain-containing protein [Nitrospinota bacterium]